MKKKIIGRIKEYKSRALLTLLIVALTFGMTGISAYAYVDGNGSEVDALGNRYELVSDPDGSGWYVFQCTDPNGIKYYPGSVGTQGLGGGTYTRCVDPETRAKITGPYAYKFCEHEFTSETTKDATCLEPGEVTYTCGKCGYSYTEEIPKTNKHTYELSVVVEASCETAGLGKYECSVCGDSYESELPPTGHNYATFDEKQPTCTEEGSITYTCTNCGDTYTKAAPMTGHVESEWEVTTESTMFSSGSKQIVCKTCGEVLRKQVIERKSKMPLVLCATGVLLIVGAAYITSRLGKHRHRSSHKD